MNFVRPTYCSGTLPPTGSASSSSMLNARCHRAAPASNAPVAEGNGVCKAANSSTRSPSPVDCSSSQ